MFISVENGIPQINGLPIGSKIIFLGKISEQHGYCVIYRPPEEYSPKNNGDEYDLSDAKMVTGKENKVMKIHEIDFGQKSPSLGGLVETKDDISVIFHKHVEDNPCVFECLAFSEVFIVT